MNTCLKKKIVTDWEEEYKLALIVEKFIYYVNEEESDENGNTMMFSKENFKLVSDNYFAYGAIMEDLERIHNGEIEPEYISGNMKMNLELLAESGFFKK